MSAVPPELEKLRYEMDRALAENQFVYDMDDPQAEANIIGWANAIASLSLPPGHVITDIEFSPLDARLEMKVAYRKDVKLDKIQVSFMQCCPAELNGAGCHLEAGHEGKHHAQAPIGPCYTWDDE